MNAGLRVASPPPQPLLIFDGDCQFCTLWIRRARQLTGDAVGYLPAQDPRVAAQYPEIPPARYAEAVQFINTNGEVSSGAAAVCRALARNPRWPWSWPLALYETRPLLARLADRAYQFVAEHRPGFSRLTRLCWGRHVEAPSHLLTRWLFLRALGAVWLVAFLSLRAQVDGLIGRDGILPVDQYIAAIKQQCDARGLGLERYHLVPTLCWGDPSNACLHAQCAAGLLLSVLLIFGVAPAPCLFLLWLLYLSLVTVGRDFYGFQWDNLLLEAGWLAIFLAPLQLLPRPARETPPSRLFLWLLRLLLFQLMFSSGCVKLLSHDPAWRNLTALTFHYQTQPLPPWTAWYARQFPVWFQQLSCAVLFAIELGAPWLIFTPRRFRFAGAALLAGLQCLISLTGNYAFFNCLTLALCLLLLDDFALAPLVPARLRPWFSLKFPGIDPWSNSNGIFSQWAKPRPLVGDLATAAPAGPWHPLRHLQNGGEGRGEEALLKPPNGPNRWFPLGFPGRRARPLHWPLPVLLLVAALVSSAAVFQLAGALGLPSGLLAPFGWVAAEVEPFRTVNGYGLFAVMTTQRNEIILEGSDDAVNWRPYEFNYKPGAVNHRPAFVAPFQPRLDWQMWFAALGGPDQSPWLAAFCERLLQGSPDVLALLAVNPFPGHPPRFLRAEFYNYQFTTPAERRATGAWWRRTMVGEYFAPVSLRQ